jgi:sec-independent protein translocase protein TatB
MFDFAWSEIALIAAVALIAIGPKDMPVAIRAITDVIKKARRMAGEFQTHVDEMLREANLDEVRGHINDIRNFDVRGMIEKSVDPDGALRDTFASNPLEPTVPAAASPVVEEIAVSEPVVAELEKPAEPARPQMPAFIPPNMAPPPVACAAAPAAEPEAPAFIPPEVVLERRSRPQA